MCQELTPDHDVSPCTRGEDYEAMRPTNPTCWLTTDLLERVVALEKEMEILKKKLSEEYKK